jgi:peptide/nickel transport system substrate-binding protein
MKQKMIVPISLLVFGALIAGCGGYAAPAPQAAPTTAAAPTIAAAPTAAPQPTTAAANQPVDGGTVTTPIGADPTFNPWHPNAFVESIFVNRVLFDGLTKPGKDLAPSPDLATKWEASSDGLTWTFTLRNDVKWSDGVAFSADDVGYTFNDVVLNKALGATGAGNYAAVKDVTVVDPQTVKFNLTRPFSALPSYLAYNAGILPKHSLASGDPFKNTAFNKEKPVSSGPFKMDSFTPGQAVTLVRNNDYFGGKAHLDKLVFKIVADANTQVAQALSGELDVMILDNKAAVDTVKAKQNLQVVPRSLVQFYWIALNQENPLFQDVRVRQAMLYAIDRQAIIKSVDKGYDTIANAAISPALASYYDASLESRYPYDPAKAKQLLADAGWKDNGSGVLVNKDGKPFAFTMDFGIRANLQPVDELVQQYFKQIGIQATLNAQEWNAMIKKDVVDRNYEMQLNWWVYPTDPDVTPYFVSTAAGKGFNIPGYKDPKLDDLLVKGQTTNDPVQRKQIYKDLQAYMADTLPYLFLWYPQEIDVMNSRVQGVAALNLRDGMHYVNEWWVSSK